MMRRSNILLLFAILFLFIMGCGNEEAQDSSEKQQKNNSVQESSSMDTTKNVTVVERKDTAKEKTTEYRNEEYGFTLRIPASWEGKYEVAKVKGDPTRDTEAIFVFIYQAEEAELFSIVVLNITKEEWNQNHAGGLLQYLGEKDGKIFAYSVPSELHHQLAQNKKEKIHSLMDMTQMINVDVPRIVQTFKLLK